MSKDKQRQAKTHQYKLINNTGQSAFAASNFSGWLYLYEVEVKFSILKHFYENCEAFRELVREVLN